MRILLLLLCVASKAWTDYENLFDTGEALCVEGVHVLTGQYLHQQQYLTLPGPEPLGIGHSFQPDWEARWGGWNPFPQTRLEIVQYGERQIRLFAADSQGRRHAWKKRGRSWRALVGSSATLPPTPEAARMDPSQDWIDWQPATARGPLIQTLSNGCKRIYRIHQHGEAGAFEKIWNGFSAPTRWWLYLCEQQTLPSGNRIRFHYDPQGELRELELQDREGRRLTSLKSRCVPKEGGCALCLTLEDQRALTFHLQDFRGKVAGPDTPPLLLPIQVEGEGVVPQQWHYRAQLKPWLERLIGQEQVYSISGIQAVSWPEGRELRFELDEQNRVVEVRRPCSHAEGLETTLRFEYGQIGENPLTRVVAADGGVREFLFNCRRLLRSCTWKDAENRVLKSVHFEWTGSEPARLARRLLVDERANPVETDLYAYDEQGRLIQHARTGRLALNLQSCQGMALGSPERESAVISLLQNALANPATIPLSTQVTQWEYDDLNRVVGVKKSQGPELTLAYEGRTDRVVAQIQHLQGQVMSRCFCSFDAAGQLVEQIEDDGSCADPQSMEGVTVRRRTVTQRNQSLPGLGLPNRIEQWCGLPGQERLLKVTKLLYGRGEQPIEQSIEDPLTHSEVHESWQFEEGRLKCHRNAVGAQLTYAYDKNGNCVEQKGPRAGETARCVYDRRNQQVSRSHGQSGRWLHQKWAYDALGRNVGVWSPVGGQTRIAYDVLDRPVAEYQSQSDRAQPVEHPSIRRRFDAADQLIEEQTGAAAGGESSHHLYGLDGRPLIVHHPDGTWEGWSYDLQGRTVWHRSCDGTEEQNEWDGVGRLWRQQTPLGLIQQKWQGNRCVQKIDPLGVSTTFSYDPAGRLVGTQRGDEQQRWQLDGENRILELWEGSLATRFVYDGSGRVLRREQGPREQPESIICWGYGVVGDWLEKRVLHPHASVCRRDFDFTGRLIATQDALGVCTRSYWTFDPTDREPWRQIDCLPDGRRVESCFDHRHQLMTVRCMKEGQELWCERRERDESGREVRVSLHEGDQLLLQQEKSWWPGGKLRALIERPSEQRSEWSYDARGRLSSLIKPSGVSLQFYYDAGNRLVARQASDHSVMESFCYDGVGRLVQCTGPDLTLHRLWNEQGRLLQEQTSHQQPIHYQYNQEGRMTRCWNGQWSQQWRWSGSHVTEASLGSSRAAERLRLDEHDVAGRPLLWRHADSPQRDTRWEQDALLRPCSVRGEQFEQRITQFGREGLWAAGVWTDLQSGKGKPPAELISWRYDASGHLVQEGSPGTPPYRVDALHRRQPLQKLRAPTEEASAHPTFLSSGVEWDQDGRVSRLERAGETWTLQWDALDRLRVAASAQKSLHFFYDPLGRLMAREKRSEKGVERQQFAYCGEKMCAVEDSPRWWVRLCLPGAGAETGSTLLCHSDEGSELFQHDLQGSLLYPDTARYTAWGESLRPAYPWGFLGKWQDPDLGAVWMGKRWLQPELGCFLSADPLGNPESWSRHAFLQHQPLGHQDLWGCDLTVHNSEQFQLPPLVRACRWAKQLSLPSGQWVSSAATLVEELCCPSQYILHHPSQHEGEQRLVTVLATGIQTPVEECRRWMRALSNWTDGHGVYCAWRSDSSFGGNLLAILRDKLWDGSSRGRQAAELAHHLVGQWSGQQQRPRICVVSHSAGARSAEVFCKTLCDLGWGDQVHSLTLGGAAVIEQLPLADAINVRHCQDPVPSFACPIRSGQMQQIGAPGGWSLDAHAFESPGYQGCLREFVERVHSSALRMAQSQLERSGAGG